MLCCLKVIVLLNQNKDRRYYCYELDTHISHNRWKANDVNSPPESQKLKGEIKRQLHIKGSFPFIGSLNMYFLTAS